MPTHFYEDGIKRLEMLLGFQMKVATEHLQGNDKYNITDAIMNFAEYATAAAKKR